jgi:hypothetical protein
VEIVSGLTTAGPWAVIVWVVWQLMTTMKTALEANTAAITELRLEINRGREGKAVA